MQDQRPARAPRPPADATLSLAKAQDLAEAALGGPVAPLTVRALASLAGFAPEQLSWLIEACLEGGCLEVTGGSWGVIRDPVRFAVVPRVRERITTLPLAEATALCALALAEPFSADRLLGAEAELAARLLREGELRRLEHGLIEFRFPAIAEAARRLGSEELRARVHGAALAGGTPTIAAIHWAAGNWTPVEHESLTRSAADALERHEWQTVSALAELAEDVNLTAPDKATATLVRCDLRLNAAFAARFLADSALSHAHLDRAEQLLRDESPAEPETLRARIAIARAELLHYQQGDLDAALEALIPGYPAPVSPAIAAHLVLHLVRGGRHR